MPDVFQDEQLTTEEKLQLKTPENKENISDTSITSCEFSPREPNVQVSVEKPGF